MLARPPLDGARGENQIDIRIGHRLRWIIVARRFEELEPHRLSRTLRQLVARRLCFLDHRVDCRPPRFALLGANRHVAVPVCDLDQSPLIARFPMNRRRHPRIAVPPGGEIRPGERLQHQCRRDRCGGVDLFGMRPLLQCRANGPVGRGLRCRVLGPRAWRLLGFDARGLAIHAGDCSCSGVGLVGGWVLWLLRRVRLGL